MRIGIAVIFLAAGVFAYFMIAMPAEPSAVYLAGCGFAAALMIAAIIAVSVRLKRLQAEYSGSAGAAAKHYAEEMARRMRSGGK